MVSCFTVLHVFVHVDSELIIWTSVLLIFFLLSWFFSALLFFLLIIGAHLCQCLIALLAFHQTENWHLIFLSCYSQCQCFAKDVSSFYSSTLPCKSVKIWSLSSVSLIWYDILYNGNVHVGVCSQVVLRENPQGQSGGDPKQTEARWSLPH